MADFDPDAFLAATAGPTGATGAAAPAPKPAAAPTAAPSKGFDPDAFLKATGGAPAAPEPTLSTGQKIARTVGNVFVSMGTGLAKAGAGTLDLLAPRPEDIERVSMTTGVAPTSDDTALATRMHAEASKIRADNTKTIEQQTQGLPEGAKNISSVAGNLGLAVTGLHAFVLANTLGTYGDTYDKVMQETNDPVKADREAGQAGMRAVLGNYLWAAAGHGIGAGLEKVLPAGMPAIQSWAVKASAAMAGNVTMGHLVSAAEAAATAPEGQKLQAFQTALNQQDIAGDSVQMALGALGGFSGKKAIGPETVKADGEVAASSAPARLASLQARLANKEITQGQYDAEVRALTPSTSQTPPGAGITMRVVDGKGSLRAGPNTTIDQLNTFRQRIDGNVDLSDAEKNHLHSQVDAEIIKRGGYQKLGDQQLEQVQKQIDEGNHSPEEKAQLQKILESYKVGKPIEAAPAETALAPVQGAVMADANGTPLSRVGRGPTEAGPGESHADLITDTLTKNPEAADAVLAATGQDFKQGSQAGHAFQLADGTIVDRETAASAAKQNGQVSPDHEGGLQSHQLEVPKVEALTPEAETALKETGGKPADMTPKAGDVGIPAETPRTPEKLSDLVVNNANVLKSLGLQPGEHPDSVGEGLKRLSSDPATPPRYRLLAKHLQKALGDTTKGLKLIFATNHEQNVAGLYKVHPTDPNQGTITFNLAKRGVGGIRGTFLHELVHHLTLRKLSEGYNPSPEEAKAIVRINKIYDHVLDQEFQTRNGHLPSDAERAEFKKSLAEGKTSAAPHLKNVHEFVTNLLTNVDTQSALNKLELPVTLREPGSRNVLQSVFESLRRLIGVKPGTALSEAMDAANILTEKLPEQERVSGALQVSPHPLTSGIEARQAVRQVPSFVEQAPATATPEEGGREAEMLPPIPPYQIRSLFKGRGRSEIEKAARLKEGESTVRAEVERSGLVPDHKTIQKALGGAAKEASQLEDKLIVDMRAKFPPDKPEGPTTFVRSETGNELPYVERPSGRLDARGLPINEVVPLFTNDPRTTAEQLGRGDKVRPDPATVNANKINPAIKLETDDKGDYVSSVETQYGPVKDHTEFTQAHAEDPRIQRAPTLVRGTMADIRGAIEGKRWAKYLPTEEGFSEGEATPQAEARQESRSILEERAREKGYPESLISVMTSKELTESLAGVDASRATLDQSFNDKKISTGFLHKNGEDHIPAPGLMGHYDEADKYLQANGTPAELDKWAGKGIDYMFHKGFVRIVGGDYPGEDIYVSGQPNSVQMKALKNASIEQRANVLDDQGRVMFRNPDAAAIAEAPAVDESKPAVRIARVTDENGNVTHEVDVSPHATLEDLTEAGSQFNKLEMPEDVKNEVRMNLINQMNEAVLNGKTGPSAAIVDARRAAYGMEPRIAELQKSHPEVWNEMQRELQKDPNAAGTLIKELNFKARAIEDWQYALLSREAAIRENTFEESLDEVNSAKDDASKADAMFRKLNAERDVNEVHNAIAKASSRTGRALNFLKVLVDTDTLNLDRMNATMRAAKNGVELTEREKTDNEKLFKTLKDVKDKHDTVDQLKTAQDDLKRVEDLQKHEGQSITERTKEVGGKKQFEKADKTAKSQRAVVEAKMKRQGERGTDNKALDRYKKALRTRMEKLQAKIDKGDFTRDVRKPIQLDKEAADLKTQYLRLRAQFETNIERIKRENRDWLQKWVLDPMVNFSRGAVISSPVAYMKIAAMTLNRLMARPITGLVSEGLSHMPGIGKVLERSPRAGFRLSAEAAAYSKGISRGLTDAWQAVKKGHSDLDLELGKVKGYDKGGMLLQLFQRTHSALKALAVRVEFERSLVMRRAWAQDHGLYTGDPLQELQLRQEAFKDADRDRFQQDNALISAYKAGLGRIEAPSKESGTGKATVSRRLAGAAIRSMLPVVRVPTNIVAEGLQHAFGSITGGVNAASALAKGVENLPPAQADLINRQLARGSIGLAMIGMGWFGADQIGGYFTPATAKGDQGDLKQGELSFGGITIPREVTHAPIFAPLLMAATMRKVYDAKVEDDGKSGAIVQGIFQTLLGYSEEQPFVKEMLDVSKLWDPRRQTDFFAEMVKSKIPQAVQWFAKFQDRPGDNLVDKIGKEPIARETKGFKSAVISGIPDFGVDWLPKRQDLDEK